MQGGERATSVIMHLIFPSGENDKQMANKLCKNGYKTEKLAMTENKGRGWLDKVFREELSKENI